MGDSFMKKLAGAVQRNQSLLCVGLDADPALMPIDDVAQFNRAIVDATRDLVCAYKPNLAFYDALGEKGHAALERTLDHIPSDIPVIGDSKRGDVESTSVFHAKAMFDVWGFDAATVSAYAGRDSIQPFLDYEDRGVFVWCRSSNPGAKEIQDLVVTPPEGGEPRPLYEWMAVRASTWNTNGNVGLVVGATYPDELRRVRALCPDMPLLIPGIGAQFGQLEGAVMNGIDPNGRNAVFNVSRSVIYASNDPDRFEQSAHDEAETLRNRINGGLEIQGTPLRAPSPEPDVPQVPTATIGKG